MCEGVSCLGADLAVTYLNDKAKKFVEPLADEVEAEMFLPLDVRVPDQLESAFEQIKSKWYQLDFLVHFIAFSPREALQGRVIDVGQDGFQQRCRCIVGPSFAWRILRNRS